MMKITLYNNDVLHYMKNSKKPFFDVHIISCLICENVNRLCISIWNCCKMFPTLLLSPKPKKKTVRILNPFNFDGVISYRPGNPKNPKDF